MYQSPSALVCETELAVGSRVQVVKGPLEHVAGQVFAIRGGRLLVAPDVGSRGVFVEIDRSVTEIADVIPGERPAESTDAG